jgi:CubicO group peptidase (beta-lactamase class C family)
MTLKDVLTMRTGLEWIEDVPYDDPRSDSSLMEATDDWIRYVIDKPMAREPGTAFNYSSGATELLAYIFKKETGQDIDAYAEKFLFAPLGMRHHWKRTYRGVVDTEGGLYLSGSDLAKIGYLYLHDGVWAGKRLLSEEWVKESLTPAVATGWQGLQYGFKWWLYPRKDGKELVWLGIGFGGQRLMVFPAEQMIATFTGWDILKDIAFDAELAERVSLAARGSDCSGGPN